MIRGINQLPYVTNFQSQERLLQPTSIRLQYNMLVLKDKHMMIIQLPKMKQKEVILKYLKYSITLSFTQTFLDRWRHRTIDNVTIEIYKKKH